MEATLIHTKLHPPQTGSDLIERPLTTLTGQVTDQAALMGILNHLYDMQCPLISVEYLIEG